MRYITGSEKRSEVAIVLDNNNDEIVFLNLDTMSTQLMPFEVYSVSTAMYSPDGDFLAVGDNNRTNLFDLRNGSRVFSKYLVISPWKINFIENGRGEKNLHIRSGDKSLLCDINGNIQRVLSDNRSNSSLASIANETYLGTDATGFYEVNTLSYSLFRRQSYEGLLEITTAPDSKYIVAGFSNGTVQIWNKELLRNKYQKEIVSNFLPLYDSTPKISADAQHILLETATINGGSYLAVYDFQGHQVFDTDIAPENTHYSLDYFYDSINTSVLYKSKSGDFLN